MTCGKCGAELIGSAKFCAACGTATPSAPPATHASASARLSDAIPPAKANPLPPIEGANLLVLPDISPAPPSGGGSVNPFAATAPPGAALPSKLPSKHPSSEAAIRAVSGAMAAQPVAIEAKVDSSAPPVSPRAVSPLAMSNGISGRTPFQEAVEKARQSVAPEQMPKPKKMPGTQMMVNAPKRPPKPDDAAPAAEEPKKRAVPKTVAMTPPRPNLANSTPQPHSNPTPSSGSGGAPNSYIAAPGSVLAPGSVGGAPNSYIAAPGSVAPGALGQQFQPGPGSVAPGALGQQFQPGPGSVAPGALGQQFQQLAQPPPGSVYNPQAQQPPQQRPMQPLAPYQQPPAPQYPPPQWGAPPPSYGFQFAPGARVQVTWSNGQRYPATVGQVNGAQCLVVFPDGQQHWVQLQYLSPG